MMLFVRSFVWLVAVFLGISLIVKAEEIPLTVAVLDFRDTKELAGTGAAVSALLQAKLCADSDSPLLERAEVQKIFSEQKLMLTDGANAAQAQKVGLITGAEALISGRVFSAQDRIYLAIKLMSARTGQIFGFTADYARGGEMEPAIAALSEKIARALKEKRAELCGGKPLEELQAEKLKSMMKEKKSPVFFLAIKENPEVVSELCRVLKAAGWVLAESEEKAEVVVHGEASAEIRSYRGELHFVRARLDFSVKISGGKSVAGQVVAGNVESSGNKDALRKVGLLSATEIAGIWLAN